jgi:hypothetical protein
MVFAELELSLQDLLPEYEGTKFPVRASLELLWGLLDRYGVREVILEDT